jgi:hypothetical protein
VKIDYQVLSLKEFAARFSALVNAPGALRLHISPFNDQITVERRTLDEAASISRSGIWQIKKSVMRNVLPAFGSTVGSVLAAPGVTGAVVSGVQRALRATLDRAARGVVMYAHEWIRDFPQEAWKSRYTYTLWGFPQSTYPRLLGEYFAFCRSHYKQHGYRCNVVNGASRLHQDRSSLFSVSYQGPMITLEPSSTGVRGGRRAHLQSVACAQARACGQGVRRAGQVVPRAAPAHRPSQSAVQQLLLASPRLMRRWRARGRHQPLSCRCASRNHRYLSISRDTPVNRSAVSASPNSAVSSMAALTDLPNTANCVDR